LQHRRAVLVSYSITAICAVVALQQSLQYYFNAYGYFFPSGLFFVFPLPLFIAGLVLGPYFGLAGLIAEKQESVWIEARRLIERHISFPFIAGAALLYGSLLGYGSGTVGIAASWYIVFVVLASVIVWKTRKPAETSAQNPATTPP
jgi:hypothetical protein